MLQPILKLRNNVNSVKVVRPFKDVNKKIELIGNEQIVEFQYNPHDLKDEINNIEKWLKDNGISIIKEEEIIEKIQEFESEKSTFEIVENIEDKIQKRAYKKRSKIQENE